MSSKKLSTEYIGGWLLLCLTTATSTIAQQSESKADSQSYSLELTTKIHSTGHSPYTGVYLNHHENAEINLSYKYKQFGGFINKNVDISDIHSPINFTTTGIYWSFKLSESLKVSPYIGYFFRQSHSLMDESSDMWSCLVVTFTVNRWMQIENSTLIGNLIRNPRSASLANRINVSIWIKKFKIDVFAWYNCSINPAPYFSTASLAVTSPEWIITPSISVKMQVAMVQQISGERPENAMHRAGLISLIVPVDFSEKR